MTNYWTLATHAKAMLILKPFHKLISTRLFWSVRHVKITKNEDLPSYFAVEILLMAKLKGKKWDLVGYRSGCMQSYGGK